MIDILFNNYPMEFGIKRVKVYSKDDLYNLINRWNGKLDCYCSLYGCEDNLTIDKIYLDLDSPQCWENVKKAHKILMEKNIEHYVQFTGGGFGLFIFVEQDFLKNPKTALETAQINIAHKLGLTIGKPHEADIDDHVIGDVRRITRIPYTFNVKSDRKRFCMPIIKEDFDKTFDEIKNIALGQRFSEKQKYIFGDKKVNIKLHDKDPDILKVNIIDGNNIDYSTVDTDLIYLKGKLPPLIIWMLKEQKCGWKDRYYTILAFREAGFPMPLCVEYCRKHWLQDKFNHCLRDEKDFHNIYKNSKLFFPNWDFLKKHGYPVSKEDILFTFYK